MVHCHCITALARKRARSVERGCLVYRKTVVDDFTGTELSLEHYVMSGIVVDTCTSTDDFATMFARFPQRGATITAGTVAKRFSDKIVQIKGQLREAETKLNRKVEELSKALVEIEDFSREIEGREENFEYERDGEFADLDSDGCSFAENECNG
eukprot:TRINITY_DN54507_c0_g1_i1.p1 TRINITY_DN54507_c0_g1~~TRINITY_DN54507_c0_g1_i1.p1  ORF type:complete len:154 (-),score=28.60 TRINITY_DN54507_c0_g1_i1:56-517(-)